MSHNLQLSETAAATTAPFARVVQQFLVAGGFPLQQYSSEQVQLDPMDHLRERYGVKDICLFLMRPDMYAGFCGGIDRTAELSDYLQRVLIASPA